MLRDASAPAAGQADPPNRRQLRGRRGVLLQLLGRGIGAGRIPVGALLDPVQLCDEFGVSRTVVRETFQVLTAKGMLDPRPRIGTHVAPIEEWDLLDHDVITWWLSGEGAPSGLTDLLMLCASLEPMFAREAAREPNPDLGSRLEAICAHAEGYAHDGNRRGFEAEDLAFHLTLLHDRRSLIYQQLSGTVAAIWHARNRLGMMPEKMSLEHVELHRSVAKAITEGDPDTAELTMRDIAAAAIEDHRRWAVEVAS